MNRGEADAIYPVHATMAPAEFRLTPFEVETLGRLASDTFHLDLFHVGGTYEQLTTVRVLARAGLGEWNGRGAYQITDKGREVWLALRPRVAHVPTYAEDRTRNVRRPGSAYASDSPERHAGPSPTEFHRSASRRGACTVCGAPWQYTRGEHRALHPDETRLIGNYHGGGQSWARLARWRSKSFGTMRELELVAWA